MSNLLKAVTSHTRNIYGLRALPTATSTGSIVFLIVYRLSQNQKGHVLLYSFFLYLQPAEGLQRISQKKSVCVKLVWSLHSCL